MKDHPERKGRLQLIEAHVRRSIVANGDSREPVEHVSVHRLPPHQRAREKTKLHWLFSDDRHGHPYKLTEPMQVWISELCSDDLRRLLRAEFNVN